MRLITTLFLACLFVVPAATRADEKSELKKLAGDYKVLSMQRGGMKAPAQFLKVKLNIKGNVFTLITPAKGMDRKSPRTAKVDDGPNPNHIDLSNDRGSKYVGIYKLEGKKLTICYNRMGPRPKKFASPAGTPTMLMVFERVK